MFGNRGKSAEKARPAPISAQEYSRAMSYMDDSQPAVSEPITQPIPLVSPIGSDHPPVDPMVSEIAKMSDELGVSLGDVRTVLERIITHMGKDLGPSDIKSRFAAIGRIAAGEEGYLVDSEGNLQVSAEVDGLKAELKSTRENELFARRIAVNLATNFPEDRANSLDDAAQTLVQDIQEH